MLHTEKDTFLLENTIIEVPSPYWSFGYYDYSFDTLYHVIIVKNCFFKSENSSDHFPLGISNKRVKNRVRFINNRGVKKYYTFYSNLEKGIYIQSNEAVTFSSTHDTISGRIYIGDKLASLEIDNSRFLLQADSVKKSTLYLDTKADIDIVISNSIIDVDSAYNNIIFYDTINSLTIKDSDIKADIDLNELTINSKLEVYNSSLNHIDIFGVHLPQHENVCLSWDQLTQGLSLFDQDFVITEVIADENPLGGIDTISFGEEHHIVYHGLSNSQQENRINHDNLMALHQKFYNIYRDRGDLESANSCYVALKQLQTQRLAFKYSKEPNMKNWFNWQLNVFLKFFCNYGTSPVQAVIISMWVILLFSVVYFFFYSDWDGINRQFLIDRYRRLLHFFNTEQKMEDFYTQEHIEEFKNYKAFKIELQQSKKRIPLYFHIMGLPLYAFSILQFKFKRWIFGRFEMIKGKWVDLEAWRKWVTGTKVFIGLIVYILYLILTKVLNSLILSINAFSTLGFGNIPVKNAIRYFTIIEGFIGWFLLSIFSVSLISQILQS